MEAPMCDSAEASSPVTEESAWEFARNLNVMPSWTEQMVGHWHADRSFRGWETSGDNPKPITRANWRDDLRRSHRWAQNAAAPTIPTHIGPAPLSSQKKLPGAGPEAPDWDWRAIFADRFDHAFEGEWRDLGPDMRKELEILHNRQLGL